jgi:GNAT superfamily N-acetyltransferase
MIGDLDAIQAYFRQAARERYDTIESPEGSVHFHPTSAEPSWNYAVPNARTVECHAAFLEATRRACRERGRQLRLEFIEELFPDLATALEQAGMHHVERQLLMFVTPDEFISAPATPGYTLEVGGRGSELSFLLEVAATQCHAFSGVPLPTEAVHAQDFREAADGLCLALVRSSSSEAVAAGALSPVSNGFGELTGLGTVPAHRLRGLGAWISSLCVEEAWRRGATRVVLTTSGEPAERTYRRLGFRPAGHVSVWAEPNRDRAAPTPGPGIQARYTLSRNENEV